MHKIVDITSGKKHGGFIKVTLDTSIEYPKARLDAVFEDGLEYHGHEYPTIFVNSSAPTQLRSGSIERRHANHLAVGGGYSGTLSTKACDYLEGVLAPALDELYADAEGAALEVAEYEAPRMQAIADEVIAHAQKVQAAAKRLAALRDALAAGESVPRVKANKKYGSIDDKGHYNFSSQVPWGVGLWVQGRLIGVTGFRPRTGGGFDTTANGGYASEWARNIGYLWNQGLVELSGLE